VKDADETARKAVAPGAEVFTQVMAIKGVRDPLKRAISSCPASALRAAAWMKLQARRRRGA
jgi:hypothetical protein